MMEIRKDGPEAASAGRILRVGITLFSTGCTDFAQGWCLTSFTSRENNNFQVYLYQTCSMRPAFLPRSRSQTKLWERSPFRRRSPYDGDENFMTDEDFYEEERDDFYSRSRRDQWAERRRPRDDMDYFDDDEDNEETTYGDGEHFYDHETDNYVVPPPRVEWEEIQAPNPQSTEDDDASYSTVYVLLPPSPPTMHPLPSAVLHFVGGTLFGSAPKLWYRTLLEDIVTHTQCAIVITPLPVITPLNSRQSRGPLHHVSMAKRLKHQFQYAYEYVLADEYGSEAMKSVPIAGLGHSLGSRLLVVLATLMKDTPEIERDNKARRKQRRVLDLDYQYKSLILISFTNFEAAAGIPGITSLLKQRIQIDKKNTQRQEKQPEVLRNRGRRISDWEDELDEEEDEDLLEELSELWGDFQGVFQSQADRVRTVLTPKSEDLEFYPTPRQLWKALEGNPDKEGDEGASRYNIPLTLLIQFDQDDMDQSSKLASVLVSKKTSNAAFATAGKELDKPVGATTTATVTARTVVTTDLKFARLRGTHLTPISTGNAKEEDLDGFERKNKGIFHEWSSRSTKTLWKLVQGRITGGSLNGMTQQEALRDLRRSITRYITDVVTK